MIFFSCLRGKREKRRGGDRDTDKRGKVDIRCQSQVIREEANEFPLQTKKKKKLVRILRLDEIVFFSDSS